MKVKLLKRLRREGRNQITILSITNTDGISTGMSYSFNDLDYSGLFSFGDTEEDVINKAVKIYIEKQIKILRNKKIKFISQWKKYI